MAISASIGSHLYYKTLLQMWAALQISSKLKLRDASCEGDLQLIMEHAAHTMYSKGAAWLRCDRWIVDAPQSTLPFQMRRMRPSHSVFRDRGRIIATARSSIITFVDCNATSSAAIASYDSNTIPSAADPLIHDMAWMHDDTQVVVLAAPAGVVLMDVERGLTVEGPPGPPYDGVFNVRCATSQLHREAIFVATSTGAMLVMDARAALHRPVQSVPDAHPAPPVACTHSHFWAHLRPVDEQYDCYPSGIVNEGRDLYAGGASISGIASVDNFVFTAGSSDGVVKVWDMRRIQAGIVATITAGTKRRRRDCVCGAVHACVCHGTYHVASIHASDAGRHRPARGIVSMAVSYDNTTLAVAHHSSSVVLYDIPRLLVGAASAEPQGVSSTTSIDATPPRAIVRGRDATGGCIPVASPFRVHPRPPHAAADTIKNNMAINRKHEAVQERSYPWRAAAVGECIGHAAWDFTSELAFSPCGSSLAITGADGRVYLWDVAAARGPHASLPSRVLQTPDMMQAVGMTVTSTADADPDAMVIAVAHADGPCFLWRAPQRQAESCIFDDLSTQPLTRREMGLSTPGSMHGVLSRLRSRASAWQHPVAAPRTVQYATCEHDPGDADAADVAVNFRYADFAAMPHVNALLTETIRTEDTHMDVHSRPDKRRRQMSLKDFVEGGKREEQLASTPPAAPFRAASMALFETD